MLDTYWDSTNNCFRNMKLNNASADNQQLPNYEVCNKTHDCYIRNNMLKQSDLIFTDYQKGNIHSKETIRAINKLNISYKFKDSRDYQKLIYRLLANPTTVILNSINEDVKAIKTPYTTIHLRTGGYLANYKEGGYWVTPDELPKVTKFINNTIKKNKFENTVFLSTDSDISELYLKQNLPNLRFINRRPYQRSHSTTRNKYSSFEGAIYDYFVAAQGKQIIYSKTSSFSNIVLKLTQSKTSIPLNTHFRINNTNQKK